MTRIVGDCREVLATLPKGSVQCVVTSPPYWGLRDYGTASWEGGKRHCDHAIQRSSKASTLGLAKGIASHEAAMRREAACPIPYRDTCGKCGARRIDAQLGLEATPEEFIANMVGVFRLVRQVLADDGTLWVNMGDSYVGGGGFWPNSPSNLAGAKQTTQPGSIKGTIKPQGGLKPKDLCGMPWRLAFALQADGWYLRSDIIWHKPNPMPESVTDRPTKSHEYLFLLSKRERYYYDATAIREPCAAPPVSRKRSGMRSSNIVTLGLTRGTGNPSCSHPNGKNKRTVWSIASRPFKGAHFATYPPKLVEPCILAGSRPGDVVLDPFGGSGTTAEVAQRLGRKWILIELNRDYGRLIDDRVQRSSGALVRGACDTIGSSKSGCRGGSPLLMS